MVVAFLQGDATGITGSKVLYSILSKLGNFNYVLLGLPDGLSLKDPSSMGKATLDKNN